MLKTIQLKNFKFQKYISFFSVFFLIFAVFSIGFFTRDYISKNGNLPFQNVNAQSTNSSASMDLYWKVYALLEDKHIKAQNVSSQDKIYGAIQGLTASYNDPFTTFFPPSDAEQFKTSVSGAFEGVGMEVGLKEKVLTVIAPLKNSPAEKSGMKADDKILSINATSTENMTVEAAIKLIRGPKGTPVTLKVYRPSTQKIQDITIIREKIDLPIVDTENLKNAYKINLYSFSENSPQKFQEAMKSFADSGKKNLIVDLRNNPGGYLEAAVFVSSLFIEKDKNIVTEDFTRKNLRKEHPSLGLSSWPADYKIIVLVNKGSASASEIVAGALQDYGRAKIVGEKTYGKGSVQEYIELDGGTSIKITVAKWLTPLGNSISDNGVTPDIIIPFKENLQNKKADNQLTFALNMFYNWKKYEVYSASSGNILDLSGNTSKATTTNLFKQTK